MPDKQTIAELKTEIVVLRDLLETQYRETDKARIEAEKADDEALELKQQLTKLRLLGFRGEHRLLKRLRIA